MPSQSCALGLCVGSGPLRITLTWDQPADLDLHVVPPECERQIYYDNRIACGGNLDVDDLGRLCPVPLMGECLHASDGLGPENVFWESAAPTGTYVVCVVPYAGAASSVRGGPALPFPTSVTGTLRVDVGGGLRPPFSGTFHRSPGGPPSPPPDRTCTGQSRLRRRPARGAWGGEWG